MRPPLVHRITRSSPLLAGLLCLASACKDPVIRWDMGDQRTVAVTPEALNLEVGQVAHAVASVMGVPFGTDHSLRWQVQDTTIANLTSVGASEATVQARRSGRTLLIATLAAEPTISAASIVTVR